MNRIDILAVAFVGLLAVLSVSVYFNRQKNNQLKDEVSSISSISRFSTSMKFKKICIEGMIYYKSANTLAPKLTKEGWPVKCKKKKKEYL